MPTAPCAESGTIYHAPNTQVRIRQYERTVKDAITRGAFVQIPTWIIVQDDYTNYM